ncbi:hypothetical protein LCGC14_1379610 [marine sediment metagenome]|uniref:Uncharacterized protein n=1 Tax=marine sediment metagenome TaxID=412755 RepID=A0A0F9MIE5_9ZZZZ
MLRYQLVKATRRLRILLGGYREKELEHAMFRLFHPPKSPFSVEGLGEVLRKHGFYYNSLSTTYRKQIYTARKILSWDHQIHIRFYSDGWVTGHGELRPECHPLEHLEGVEVKPLSEGAIEEVRDIFKAEGWPLT